MSTCFWRGVISACNMLLSIVPFKLWQWADIQTQPYKDNVSTAYQIVAVVCSAEDMADVVPINCACCL